VTLKVRDKNAGSIAVKTQGVENERVEMPDQKPGLEIAAAKMRDQKCGTNCDKYGDAENA